MTHSIARNWLKPKCPPARQTKHGVRNGILFSHRKEQGTCYNLNEPWNHCVKWTKLVIKCMIFRTCRSIDRKYISGWLVVRGRGKGNKGWLLMVRCDESLVNIAHVGHVTLNMSKPYMCALQVHLIIYELYFSEDVKEKTVLYECLCQIPQCTLLSQH